MAAIMVLTTQLLTLLLLATVARAQLTPYTGINLDVERWCGKAYKPETPSFNPGGFLYPPLEEDSDMLLLNVVPRHSIYVQGECSGQFIIDADVSRINGLPFDPQDKIHKGKLDTLYYTISSPPSQIMLASGQVPMKTTGNLVTFNFTALQPRLDPYPVLLTAGPSKDKQTYHAVSQMYYLPAKSKGSMVKIDNLYGGLLFANVKSGFNFEPLLPFGFYSDCKQLQNLNDLKAYHDLGLTGINPVCDFRDGDLTALFDATDQLNIPFQYDMRNSFHNLTAVEAQVPLIKDRSSFLSWYTADEPDGWQYSFKSTTAAYDLLKKLDPYHPTGLVLNCQNYYFKEYTSTTTDYIMTDPYPVGINTTYSKWGTVCNTTYGDCGCDNCRGNLSILQNVANRLYDFNIYQGWLNYSPRKPLWAVLQAFHGEGYWSRDPTPAETEVMSVLAFNHGAKAVMSWQYPSSSDLNKAHGDIAKVVTKSPVRDFLLGANPVTLYLIGQPDTLGLDIAYWESPERGDQIMLGLANFGPKDLGRQLVVPLDAEGIEVVSVVSQPWGYVRWGLNGTTLTADGVDGLGTSFVILETKTVKLKKGHKSE